MPIVADIHFHYRRALEAADAPRFADAPPLTCVEDAALASCPPEREYYSYPYFAHVLVLRRRATGSTGSSPVSSAVRSRSTPRSGSRVRKGVRGAR